MKPRASCCDPAYLQWRAQFAPFEASCFDGFCDFVRGQLEELLDRYYAEGHHSLHEFPWWAFELYLTHQERNAASENLRE